MLELYLSETKISNITVMCMITYDCINLVSFWLQSCSDSSASTFFSTRHFQMPTLQACWVVTLYPIMSCPQCGYSFSKMQRGMDDRGAGANWHTKFQIFIWEWIKLPISIFYFCTIATHLMMGKFYHLLKSHTQSNLRQP